MREGARVRDLKTQRAALVERIKEASARPSADLVLPTLERALEALDVLIAREAAQDGSD